jgi:hypothetical protein
MELPKIPDEEIVQTMNGVIEKFLKPKFISLGMNATGQWLNSLEGRAVNGNGEIWGMDYAYWLAHGRKPGTAPPVSALIPWVNAKLGIGGKEAIGIAFAVASKIKAEGTKYYPEGTDLLEVLNSPECKAYITEQLQTFYSIEINKILIKQLNDNFAHS